MSIEQVLIPTMWAIVSTVAVIREQEACVRKTPGEPQLSGPPLLPPSSMKDWPGQVRGLGAPVAELANVQLDLAHAAASIATLLRTPSLVTVRTTLLQELSGEVKTLSTVPRGKIV